ncbi:MAG: hypothetical protein U9O98_06110, partial [Asgard group archaeon]|nr:hypothetical protein [Asgard group archaeon]
MVSLKLSSENFLFFKRIPVFFRFSLAAFSFVLGILMQLLLPIKGIFPFEETTLSIYFLIPFIVGFLFLVFTLVLLLPQRITISNKPAVIDQNTGQWEDTTMGQLSDVFNHINRKKVEKKFIVEIFDFHTGKGKFSFFLNLFVISTLYLVILRVSNRFYSTTIIFILDIFLFIIPLWFIVKFEDWEPDFLRKVLFYHNFSTNEKLADMEYEVTPYVFLQKIKMNENSEEFYFPTNVRFSFDFEG